MYEPLLFLHVLAAFALVATVVIQVAFAAGAPAPAAAVLTADRLWDVGGLGTLVFGVWLALDSYDLFDSWVLAALVLWAAAAAVAGLARRRAGDDPVTAAERGRFGWVFTGPLVVIVLALLWVMISKPGA